MCDGSQAIQFDGVNVVSHRAGALIPPALKSRCASSRQNLRCRARRGCGTSPGRRSRPRCHDRGNCRSSTGCLTSCWSWRWCWPRSAAVCCPQDRAAVANCDPSQRVVGEGNIVEIGGGPAGLIGPGDSHICGVQDSSAPAHRKPEVCCICYREIKALYWLIEE